MTNSIQQLEAAQARRNELKEISQTVKTLVKAGEFKTVNEALIKKIYKQGNATTFKTIDEWNKEGYKVRKGSKAYAIWGKEIEVQNEDSIIKFFPLVYLFSNEQVFKTDSPVNEVQEEKAPYMVKEYELSISKKQIIEGPKIVSSSRDLYEFAKGIFGNKIEHREMFVVFLLNRSNRLIGYSIISSGGVTGTVADPKIIFQAALMANSCQIIIAHNHPSGTNKPSEADIRLTKKLKAAGDCLDIHLLDHLIVCESSYYSFADEGLI